MRPEIPDKVYFKIGEVSQFVGVQPHVLRYWESEFPSLKPVRASSNQRLYRRQDLETFLEIKRLLYEEKFTIDGARKKLRDRTREPGPDRDHEFLLQVRDSLLEIKKILGED